MKDAITLPAWFLPGTGIFVSYCFSTPFAALTEISCNFVLFRLQLTKLVW